MSVISLTEKTNCADPMNTDANMPASTILTELPDPDNVDIDLTSGKLEVRFVNRSLDAAFVGS